MYVWVGKYEDWNQLHNDVPAIVTKQFDDSCYLLDCILDGQMEIYEYMFKECIRWAKKKDLHFTGFEITAE